MKAADPVSLLAVGISVCLHLSLLLLAGAEPSQRAEALKQDSSRAFLVVSLPEEKAEFENTPEINPAGPTPSAVHAASDENSGTSGADIEAEGVAPIPQETYFLLSELEEPPRIIKDINPNPANLETYTQGGRVVLQLWIDEEGNVVDQELVETMLPPVFVDSAMQNFAQAKFVAGIKWGRPVKSTVKVVINYDPMVS